MPPESDAVREFFGPHETRQRGREWVTVYATAAVVQSGASDNVRSMLRNATINGRHWLFAPADPSRPALLELSAVPQFGRPANAVIAWDGRRWAVVLGKVDIGSDPPVEYGGQPRHWGYLMAHLS